MILAIIDFAIATSQLKDQNNQHNKKNIKKKENSAAEEAET